MFYLFYGMTRGIPVEKCVKETLEGYLQLVGYL